MTGAFADLSPSVMLSIMKASLCPYEKTILSNQFVCSCSRRGQQGERAIIECEQPDAYISCSNYLNAARASARFTLKIDDPDQPLPFGKESKLLYGSLLGLVELLENDANNKDRKDIRQLILKSVENYGNCSQIPYETIVRQISSYTPRKGRRRHKVDD